MLGCSQSGTLIATIIIPHEIHLFSDGRVINRKTHEVNDRHSKLHKINERVGILVAGPYIASLPNDITLNCEKLGKQYVDEVAEVASLVLSAIWEQAINKVGEEKLNKHHIFVFISGFDIWRRPRLFYLDQNSKPKFVVQERSLFSHSNIEIAAMSTGSNVSEDPALLLTESLRCRSHQIQNGIGLTIVFREAFDNTKARLSMANERIGGVTFQALIDENGYLQLS